MYLSIFKRKLSVYILAGFHEWGSGWCIRDLILQNKIGVD